MKVAWLLVAVLLARRWFGQNRRTVVRAGAIGVFIIAVCTLLGVAEVANSAAYDYRLQTEHIELVDGFNHHDHPVQATTSAGVQQTDACVGTCAAKQSTLGLHVRAVTYASALLLATNALLVAWLLAVGGDRLWKRARPDHTSGITP
jgi:threonine dehydrogenase-like Zn-dependent dehydrogenase